MATEATKNQYWPGTGRRKTAVASVRISEGADGFSVNGQKTDLPANIVTPLELVGKKDSLSLSAHVNGGGKVSQLEAIRLGLARALVKYNSEFRLTLKKAGFLTRDSREKERKKPGLKGARRAPQWSKR